VRLFSWQVAKVNDGRCDRVAGTNTAQFLPLASIFKVYVAAGSRRRMRPRPRPRRAVVAVVAAPGGVGGN
jgi:hypothetical protein